MLNVASKYMGSHILHFWREGFFNLDFKTERIRYHQIGKSHPFFPRRTFRVTAGGAGLAAFESCP